MALSSDRPEQWQESLQGMRHTLDDTILLTDRLLQLARIKAHHGEELPRVSVDLAAILRDACFSSYTAARNKQIDLGYEGMRNVRYLATRFYLANCARICWIMRLSIRRTAGSLRRVYRRAG